MSDTEGGDFIFEIHHEEWLVVRLDAGSELLVDSDVS